jgi:hypothetical protein
MKKTRDLPPKPPAKIKGGRIGLNDNVTFLRAGA